MGIEYYLVCPDKKEIFYLGKHVMCPDGIINAAYISEANLIAYDNFEKFFYDFFRENFREIEIWNLYFSDVKKVIKEIYDWCKDKKIYFDHDCSKNSETWINWKETGSLCDSLEKLTSKMTPIYASCMEKDLALQLFDGDEIKAQILLELLGRSQCSIPDFSNLQMTIEDE